MARTVGIVGGMGPAATVEFMRRIVAATPAADDRDHLRMLVDNNPKIPSRLRAILEGDGEDPAPVLEAMARGLARAGADFLAIPCNTAHHYLDAVRAASPVPVLDMLGETLAVLAGGRAPAKRVGLLASPALRKVGLLDRRFQAAGVAVVHPDAAGEAALERVIRAVKGAGAGEAEREAYAGVARGLAGEGVDALLVACTELSMPPPPDAGVPVLDTLDTLVAAVIREATLPD
ncbi:aspartate/glutamate racemase family protein [Aureimonas leprariae]|uniref:Amino acid racemase n=1 Tax=Plantimonas leprariae TaxID=2615207 RepID=A0A7V7U179_9HYPH|nr:amino acid racemase [Aureimonas leprariae]KAB0681482.1 amino acid racemase [Aureimonas leprariae]